MRPPLPATQTLVHIYVDIAEKRCLLPVYSSSEVRRIYQHLTYGRQDLGVPSSRGNQLRCMYDA